MHLKPITILLCLLYSLSTQASWEDFHAGRFAEAVTTWQTTLPAQQPERARIQAMMARACRHLGLYDKAAQILDDASPEQASDTVTALLLSEQSKLALANDRFPQAKTLARQALAAARRGGDQTLLAATLNHWGSVLRIGLDYAAALQAYAEALALLPPSHSHQGVGDLRAKILLNRAEAQRGDTGPALQAAFKAVRGWRDRYGQVLAMLRLVELSRNGGLSDARRVALLRDARSLAVQLDNPKALSYAYGYSADYHYRRGAYDQAAVANRQAIFFARQVEDPLAQARWQHQLGMSHKAQGQLPQALAAYRRAVTLLTPLRQQAGFTGYRIRHSFRAEVAPLYFELADLLLRGAEAMPRTAAYQARLAEARAAIENFKQAELQSYLQGRCIGQSRCIPLEDWLDAQTAVLYPILQADRIDLLLSVQGEIHHVAVPVSRRDLNREAAFFLQPLQRHPAPEALQRSRDARPSPPPQSCSPAIRGSEAVLEITPLRSAFFQSARRLHRWLIEPLQTWLENIDTLVVVPDGVLRQMPFAALHDGDTWLLERYALAVSPGLCLTAETGPGAPAAILLGGLSESTQGFAPLPCAEYELNTLRELGDQEKTVLFNQGFTRPAFQRSIEEKGYAVVHLASHGKFNPRPEDSFILTYDGKLGLRDLGELAGLGRLREQPLELLTLSACETAKGNDRAALGLAGVTLQSGARSALASLWKVDDTATPAVVLEFYRQWQTGLGKARALRQAQLKLLHDETYKAYRHPYYWSAFLLIGNWH